MPTEDRDRRLAGATPTEERYRRLLRWYPRSWRGKHGAVMLGTLMDAADAADTENLTGSAAVWRAQAWSLRLHGLGERLTARAALGFAIAGLAMFLLAAAGWLLSPLPGGQWLLPALGTFFAPALTGISLAAIMRHTGFLTPPAAVAVCVTASAAFMLGCAAAIAWSVGFDEADAGVTRSLLAQSFGGLFLAAWLVGAVSVTIVASALFGRALSRVARVARVAVGALVALAAAPVIGLSLVTPTFGVLASVGVVFVAARVAAGPRHPRRGDRAGARVGDRSGARAGDREGARAGVREGARASVREGARAGDREGARAGTPSAAPPVAPRRLAPGHRRGMIAALAWVGVALTMASIAFAFMGSLWPGASIDSTRAMQLGLASGALAGLFVLAAFYVVVAARMASRVWMAFLAFACALVIAAVGGFAGDAWTFWLAGSAVLGLGAGMLVWQASSLSPGVRLLLAVGSGAALALTVGIQVVAAAAFVLAAAGIALGLWAVMPRRRAASTPVAVHARLDPA